MSELSAGFPAIFMGFGNNNQDKCHRWRETRDELAGPLAAPSRGLGFALAFEIERYGGPDEPFQGRFIDLVAFVDIDGAPNIAFETGVEQA